MYIYFKTTNVSFMSIFFFDSALNAYDFCCLHVQNVQLIFNELWKISDIFKTVIIEIN